MFDPTTLRHLETIGRAGKLSEDPDHRSAHDRLENELALLADAIVALGRRIEVLWICTNAPGRALGPSGTSGPKAES